MSDPFRSELESAHARNAQLCEENARLRQELEAARRPAPGSRPTRGGLLAALAVGGLLLLAALFLLTGRRRATAQAAPAASPADYRGIAIATPDPPAQLSGATEPYAASPPGNAAPRPASLRGAVRPCTCAKEDPLCDCCNPPFVEDSSGHKVFKAGCL